MSGGWTYTASWLYHRSVEGALDFANVNMKCEQHNSTVGHVWAINAEVSACVAGHLH